MMQMKINIIICIRVGFLMTFWCHQWHKLLKMENLNIPFFYSVEQRDMAEHIANLFNITIT